MRIVYAHALLIFASWLFLGGIALQFYPSRAAAERENRWRERQLQTIPLDQRAQWVQGQDDLDGKMESYVRLAGILVGGLGLAVALHEAALLSARYRRRG